MEVAAEQIALAAGAIRQ
ncbi:hypothetical protein NT26_0365 [Pseudorhizobium banfieldiae]|uniref:Uncharacterized protein n=2 Tax=Pseudorhizobium banfieldiae TaxID=1125847 RepID=L0NB40_9HYPH|nr:hypothetical protein NT26_0365 [Pseudorhizobium banfieldiae]